MMVIIPGAMLMMYTVITGFSTSRHSKYYYGTYNNSFKYIFFHFFHDNLFSELPGSKIEYISDDVCYITFEICYIIHRYIFLACYCQHIMLNLLRFIQRLFFFLKRYIELNSRTSDNTGFYINTIERLSRIYILFFNLN